MVRHAIPLFSGLILLVTGCAIRGQHPKYSFSDGRYRTNVLGNRRQVVYVHNLHDTVFVYPLQRAGGQWLPDTTVAKPVLLAPEAADTTRANPWFQQGSFDVDFLTIPFKYRLPVGDFPRQFTSSLNGAVYLGYRTDRYRLHYPATFLGRTQRKVHHFGFSMGGFTGLGGTAVNPWVTRNQLAIEYDGVVWSKGVAGIIGVNNFTAGLALGWDHLLDPNRRYWIYQAKPWVGFVFGLNLN